MSDREDFTYLTDTDIIAQTIATLAINITAQDLANLIITIAAQTVGIYLQPEWAALQEVDKNFRLTGEDKSFEQIVSADYAVGATKTLYICGLSFLARASAVGEADSNQMAYAGITVGATQLAQLGGNGGGGISFPKPIVIAGGSTFHYAIVALADHDIDLVMTCWGYEI